MLTTDRERSITCCFSGHRPQSLPWGYDESDEACCDTKNKILEAVMRLYDSGVKRFICGMAMGSDFYFAEAVCEALAGKCELIAAVPFAGQADRWPLAARIRYENIREMCSDVKILQEHYSYDCMMRRNRWMVDRSSCILAVYDGRMSGGTHRTLMYALEKGLHADILNPMIR